MCQRTRAGRGSDSTEVSTFPGKSLMYWMKPDEIELSSNHSDCVNTNAFHWELLKMNELTIVRIYMLDVVQWGIEC